MPCALLLLRLLGIAVGSEGGRASSGGGADGVAAAAASSSFYYRAASQTAGDTTSATRPSPNAPDVTSCGIVDVGGGRGDAAVDRDPDRALHRRAPSASAPAAARRSALGR